MPAVDTTADCPQGHADDDEGAPNNPGKDIGGNCGTGTSNTSSNWPSNSKHQRQRQLSCKGGSTKKLRRRRRLKSKPTCPSVFLLALVVMFFNARSVGNKGTVIKAKMTSKGAVYGGISESKTFNESASLSDAKYRWDAGTEGRPKLSDIERSLKKT